jgi:hypothetical protein
MDDAAAAGRREDADDRIEGAMPRAAIRID